ncbi:amino acid adenylation domain-containing protein [Haloferula sp.]|uniref:amino acid adenylation domain-containing protein n=1 Tax=Haloferula sp. TaxID=2497595 RepID=UPI00329D3D6D
MSRSPLTLPVRIASTYTAEPLQPVLRSWLVELGFAPDIAFAPFNQVLQQLLDPASPLATNQGGLNLVLVRAVDLGADSPARARSAAREVAAALGEASSRDGIQTLVMACPLEGGNGIEETFVADLGDQLKAMPGVELLDPREMEKLYPVANPYDREADQSAHMPYTEEMFAALATFFARRISAVRRKSYKVIAVDCDNTLWTGVCGESGAKGVVVDEARKSFQRFLMARRAEGYLLCMVSKNNPGDVDAVFRENSGMVIERDAFVDSAINWDPKSSNLRRLAKTLNLGLDSILFLDDNPAEIAEVEGNAPAVLSLLLPKDPADLPEFIEHLWVLDRSDHSATDSQRADFYHDEARRRALRERTSSFEEFIDGLQLEMDIEPVTESDLGRASQLTQRTNQFNTCPQPRDEAAMIEACKGMRSQQVSVRDRFGDYGTVGLMLTREDGGRLWAETFLLSCRALGKGVEQRMLRYLGQVAKSLKLPEVAIWFNDTGRNQPAREFLESIEGRWEDGMRMIRTEDAVACSLVPIVPQTKEETLEVSVPLADPELVSKIAHGRRKVADILEWASDPVRSRPELSERFLAPRGGAEEEIARVWSEVLGLESVGRRDRFVDLGGSSLQLVRVHAAIQRHFEQSFELVRMFENPTVEAQAKLVEGREEPNAHDSGSDDDGSDSNNDALAIVGMSVRLPGASSPEELWDNLRNGVESVQRFDRSELDVPGGEDDPNFVCARGLLEPEVYEGLDGGLFGIIPREAEIIDPQQRVFLELCWESMERAGYVPDDAEASGNRVGVYAGCYYDTYLPHNILSDPETHRRHLAEAQVGALQIEFGNDKDHLATRVAFKLNLKGPSLTVQTACSTSLVAVAHAAMALRSGQCDMALAGGVTVTVPQKRGYHHEEGGMLSRDGRCRPFDADSSGTVFSNGGGVVMLKRLKDAVRDGDHIHGVLKGFGMNNDGGVKHSYAAPSADGQADVIRRAHRDAGVDPRTITYVEAHGTATPLGDPIEVTGLTAAFRRATEDRNFCALGSLKSNLGHLDTAAGVCGLIKTVLSLEHGELPPLLHFEKANPRIDFESSPFFVNDKLRPWTPVENSPRRAGVSSFGVGGTNVHVVVEEAPRDVTPREVASGERVWVFSGRSDEALEQFAERLATHVDSAKDEDFAIAARSLAVGRKEMTRRVAVVARDWKSLAENLRAKKFQKHEAAGADPEMVWTFPGQGAQHPGMTSDLYEAESGYREDIDRCCEFLKPLLGEDLRDTLFAKDGGEAAERLKRTVLAQPAIFVVEWALARQWARWGFRPEMMIGHSVGEFTAACLAGVFSLEDGLGLLATRGRLMGELPGGSMLSVRMSPDALRQRLPGHLDLAACNGPELCVVAGESDAVADFAKELEAEGVNVRELHTSHAFHSRMMDEVVPRFRSVIEKITLKAPSVPILSTVTGKILTDAEATDPGYWAGHLRQTVNFHGALEAAAEEKEGRIYLEVGPGQTLTTLARQTVGRRAAGCLPSCEHPASGAPDHVRMLQSLGELWARGLSVDWDLIHAGIPALRVPLPTYPFQRKRYWIESKLLDLPLATPMAAAAGAVEDVEKAPAIDPNLSRADALLAQSRQVLEDLSGIPAEEMEAGASFLELGFDSLLLTQAARELQKAFGVPIAFRDLMQSFPNLGELVKHLEANSESELDAPKAAKPVAKSEELVVSSEPEEESGVAGPRTRIDKVSTSDELTSQQRQHLDSLIESYCNRTSKSKALTQEHRKWHADARTVNGFNRLWKEMVYQVVATKMKGCRMWDVDGNEYVDMVNGFGPNFLGHSPDFVTDAIQEQLATGLEIGPQCEVAMETAKLFCEVTGNERVCFLNTGSEAVQAAMRIARTVTGRDKILVFDKDYHGNFDPVLVRSVGKGARRRTLPLAPGIPESAVADVIVVPWGRPEALDMIREVAGELAAVLVEPVQSRQPELIPIDFVHEVKKISEENNFLMVFDEVITGVRQGPRGAQELYGIEADLATYGKVFGGGALPIGIVGGKAEYMDTFDGGQWQFGDDSFPEKDVTFFAGTFVRLPLAMAACRAVLNHVKSQPESYWKDIGCRADRLARSVDRMFKDNGIDISMVNFNSQMYLRIGDDAKHGNLVFYHLRKRGVFAMEGLPFYLTAAHTDADVDFVIRVFEESIAELQDGGFFPKPEAMEMTATLEDGVRGPFPMTEPMSEIWLASLLGEEANLAFNEMLQLRLNGPVDIEVAKAAIQDLVDRHDALRMRIPDEHAAGFVIDPNQVATIIDQDLRHEADSESALSASGIHQRKTAFDLTTGPLFRVVIARISDEEVVLQFVAHHLAADGWSFEVLIEDFTKCYEARLNGKPNLLEAVPSIVDRALRENDQADAGEDSLKWWSEVFKDGVPEVELPLKRGYGATPSYASSTCEVMLDADAFGQMRKLARDCGGTLNSTLLAGFQALLHKLSGQDRFVMTFPSAGQMEQGDEKLVGHCVNFLPLLAEVDPSKSFKELVGQASTAQMDALDHGKLTYGQLLRTLKLGRDGGRRPMMEVIFNLEPSGDPGAFGGLTSRVETVPACFSNSTIFLNMMQQPDGLLLSSTYNNELIDEGTMRRWLEALSKLLVDAAGDPSQAISNLTLLDSETKEAIDSWSMGKDVDIKGSVSSHFREACVRYPDKTALTWKRGSWSYGELAGRVSDLAAELRSHGVEPGDRVGILLSRGPDLIASIFGVLEAGGCYVPLDPGFPDARCREILNDAGVSVVISTESIEGCQTIDPAVVRHATAAPVERGSRDPAYVMYTSGSTGRPKGVVVPHRGILRLVKEADYCDLGPDETILQASTVAFDASILEVFGALLNGGRLVLLDEADTTLAGIARTVRDEKVTTLWLTTGLFELMVEEHLDDLRGVRQLLAGGDVMSPTHVKRAFEGLPNTTLINGYGPTENTTFTTCHVISEDDLDGSPLPIGRVISGSFVDIVDEAGEAVPVGVPGELRCGGKGLSLGYLGSPELTAERFIETTQGTMYRTGDLCRWQPDGTIAFVGRRDFQVKLRGYRIELGEIEAAMMAHPAVSQCKVAVRGSGAGGKRLLAWYATNDGNDLPSGELGDWLGQRLPGFMQPDRMMRVDAMPLNANGKIAVAELPEPGADSTEERRGPEGETEIKLAGIWSELLGLDAIGRDDDFFDLGGNSLGGLRMFARIRREFGLSLPLSMLLRAKNIRALAMAIDSKLDPGKLFEPASRDHLAEVQSHGDQPPVFAIHGGDGGILFYREMAEKLPKERPFMAIESPDLGHSDEIRIESIERTASKYVELLREKKPEGPYLLAGYSYGGVVAYEMARQLVAAGEQVPFLGLFDTVNPSAETRAYAFSERMSVYWNAQADKPLIGRIASIAGRFKDGVETHLRVKSEVATARSSETAEAHTELRAVQLREAHEQAMRAYEPESYDGELTLFRAEAVNDKFAIPDDYGWSGLVKELKIIEVPGQHLTMFDTGHVGPLADSFAASIQNSIGKGNVNK